MCGKICVPLVGATLDELWAEVSALSGKPIDLIEWRADCFAYPEHVLELLPLLHDMAAGLPILFTYRQPSEGGRGKPLDSEDYEKLLTAAIQSNLIAMVDIEFSTLRKDHKNTDKNLLNIAKHHGVKTILSYHMPRIFRDGDMMQQIFHMMKTQGADIVKIVTPATSRVDGLIMLNLAAFARKHCPEQPFICLATGKHGTITRRRALSLGAPFTFAAGKNPSAPGQLSIDEVSALC